MASRAIQDLMARKRALSAELAELGKESKRLRRRARDASAASSRQWVLDEGLRRRTLLIYMLADCTAAPVVVYLVGVASQRHWPAKDTGDVARLVEDVFLAADVDELAATAQR